MSWLLGIILSAAIIVLLALLFIAVAAKSGR
jgi:predicted outer membrane lipoprotein